MAMGVGGGGGLRSAVLISPQVKPMWLTLRLNSELQALQIIPSPLVLKESDFLKSQSFE